MKQPSKKQLIVSGVAAVVIGLTVFGVWHYRQGPPAYASAISSTIRKDATFDIYVPRQLPSGFNLKADDGVSYANEMLFMKFSRDDQTIFMSQQKKPQPEPPIASLKGFRPLDVSVGKAVAGEQDGNAATIVLTDTSLITITSDGTVSGGDLSLVAKRLQKIE